MEKAIASTQEEFVSSCFKTRQYLTWHELFKKEFKKFLIEKGASKIDIGKSNHFDMNGFFTSKRGQIYYFSISDLRWSKNTMLLRTAKNYKDYTGGSNCSVSLESAEQFENDFNRIVK